MRKIYLEDYRDTVMYQDNKENAFKIVKLVNSTNYHIGSFINETAVHELCEYNTWEVTVQSRPKK